MREKVGIISGDQKLKLFLRKIAYGRGKGVKKASEHEYLLYGWPLNISLIR